MSREGLDQLVSSGQIASEAFVWSEGMSEWVAYSGLDSPPSAIAEHELRQCSRCNGLFANEYLKRIRGKEICDDCSRNRIAAASERTGLNSNASEFGGFWPRVAARIIDGVILLLLGFLVMPILSALGDFILFLIGLMCYFVGYYALTTWHFGGSPGHLLMKLRIIRSDGDALGLIHSFFRTLIDFLTMFIASGLLHVICALDEEKRTLADHICRTRVVKV